MNAQMISGTVVGEGMLHGWDYCTGENVGRQNGSVLRK
jgi:hypothetical protein